MTETTIKPQVPDLSGEFYIATLQSLHDMLQPTTYFEIGTLRGHSLAVARCASLAVDPGFHLIPELLVDIFAKPHLHFYQMASDNFFARHDPSSILGGPIDLVDKT